MPLLFHPLLRHIFPTALLTFRWQTFSKSDALCVFPRPDATRLPFRFLSVSLSFYDTQWCNMVYSLFCRSSPPFPYEKLFLFYSFLLHFISLVCLFVCLLFLSGFARFRCAILSSIRTSMFICFGLWNHFVANSRGKGNKEEDDISKVIKRP